SPSNGRNPSLHSQWWLLPVKQGSQWSDQQILMLSDKLSLYRYRQQPELQTDEEWQRLQIIYEFMQNKDQFEWVTREERAFQLFRDEKFLVKEGAALLQRLSISL